MINKAILLGRIGSIDSKTLSNGVFVTKISLATNEQWKDKNGERQEKTTWHLINCFSKLGEIAQKYSKVGDVIYVEGKINISKIIGKDGIERTIQSITADEYKILPKKSDHKSEVKNESSNEFNMKEYDDEIPF